MKVVAWVVAASVAVYAVRIVIATFRNAPVRDDFDTSSCPPIDADTVLRKSLEDGWSSICKQLDDRANWPDAS